MADDQTGETVDDVNNEAEGNDGDTDDDGDLETWKASARKWERNAKTNADAVAELAQAREQLRKLDTSKTDHEKEVERVREEARTEAVQEALQKANARVLKSEVKALAANKLADPNDALRLLDLDEFDVSDDGDVDAKAINKAIDRLLADKPYLAASDGKRTFGDAGQGNRGKGDKTSSMNDLIRQKAGRQ